MSGSVYERYRAISRTFRRQPVGGGPVVLITLEGADLLLLGDVIGETARMAALVGLVADLIAEWEYGVAVAEAGYRSWSGARYGELASVPQESGKPMPEHRLKPAVEADPSFLDYKENIASLEGELSWLKGYHQALLVKRDMIRVRVTLEHGTAMAAADLGARNDEDRIPDHHGSAGQPAASWPRSGTRITTEQEQR